MQIPEAVVKRAKNLDLRIYTGTQSEDIMLLNLWLELTERREIEKIMTPEYLPLHKFLECFQEPKITFYAMDGKNRLSYLCWVSGASTYKEEKTAFVSLWIRDTFRGTKRCIQIGSLTVELIFHHYDYILGTNWNIKKHKFFRHMGYDIIAKIPSLYGLRDIYFILLAKSRFYKSGLYNLNQKIERR